MSDSAHQKHLEVAARSSERRMRELGEASRRMGHQVLGALFPMSAFLDYVTKSDGFDRDVAVQRAGPARGACDYLTSLGRGLQLLNPEGVDGFGPGHKANVSTVLGMIAPVIELVMAPRARFEVAPFGNLGEVALAPRTLGQLVFDAAIVIRDSHARRHAVAMTPELRDQEISVVFASRLLEPAAPDDESVEDQELIETLRQRLATVSGELRRTEPSKLELLIPAH